MVTIRDIPTDTDAESCDTRTTCSQFAASHTPLKSRTIDPALIERQGEQVQRQGRFLFQAGGDNKVVLRGPQEVEVKKINNSSNDILLKAKDMGIKVWQLEKFQRMIRTMLEVPADPQPPTGTTNRSHVTTSTTTGSREADLSRMLRNERLNGPSDRDSTVAISDIVPFRGPYIYIRDMDERSKPIMVRDYQKPGKGDTGDWPQFYGNSNGRCPFIPEPHRIEPEQPNELLLRKKRAEIRSAPCTRGVNRQKGEVPEFPPRAPLQEAQNGANAPVLPRKSPAKSHIPAFCPPPKAGAAHIPGEGTSNFRRRLIGGEPAASGMQPSNITSAIRSQMISSTAAAPGAKAGTSKEVHGLQRKVLQKNVPSLEMGHTRAPGLDPAAIARAERGTQAPRQTRQQVQKAAQINHEDSTQSEDEDVWMAEDVRKPKEVRKKQIKEKAPRSGAKPGYCENCRDKYDDFDEVSSSFHWILMKH